MTLANPPIAVDVADSLLRELADQHAEVALLEAFRPDAKGHASWYRSIQPEAFQRTPGNVAVRGTDLFGIRIAGDVHLPASETSAYRKLKQFPTLEFYIADDIVMMYAFNPSDWFVAYDVAAAGPLQGQVEFVPEVLASGIVRDSDFKARIVTHSGKLRTLGSKSDPLVQLLVSTWRFKTVWGDETSET